MLKNLLYVFLYMVPFYGMGMENSEDLLTRNIFKDMRNLVEQHTKDEALKTNLNEKLKNLENEAFQKNKEKIGTFAHYSALYKMLVQFDDAIHYNWAISKLITDHYWKYYESNLAKEGLKLFQRKIGDQIISVIAKDRRNIASWLIETGMATGKQLIQKGQEWATTKKEQPENLTASNFVDIKPKPQVAFIERQEDNSYGPIKTERKPFELLQERSASINNDGVMYIKNRKFYGLIEANEVLFIANEKYSNGENEFKVLKQENKIAENVDKNSFESANLLFDSQQYKDAFYVKAPIVAILIDNIEQCQTKVAGTSSLFNPFAKVIDSVLSVKAKNIIISENLAREMQKSNNHLTIKNLKHSDNTYASIDLIKYKDIEESEWDEMSPEILAEKEGYPSIAAKYQEDTAGREKLRDYGENKQNQGSLPSSSNIDLTIQQEPEPLPAKIITPDFLTNEISKLEKINSKKPLEITKEEQISIEEESSRIIAAIKEKINEVAYALYKNNTFVTDNCNLLLQISEYINELGYFKHKMVHTDKNIFINSELSKLVNEYDGRIVKLKTVDDYWLLIPVEAISKVDAKPSLDSRSYSTQKTKHELSKILTLDYFWVVPVGMRDNLNPKKITFMTKEMIEILNKEWNEAINESFYEKEHTSVLAKHEALMNELEKIITKWQNSIRHTLSEIGSLNLAQYTTMKAEGDVLMWLSTFITDIKNKVVSETAVPFFINSIAPKREYDYKDKFTLMLTNNNVYFLVPKALVDSIVDRKNNTEKKLIQSNIDFAWTRLYRVYVNAETLKAALDTCYEKGSTDLRAALKNVEDSKKRWWNPFTWDWSGGYYFKKPTYERDYPERANQYSKEGNWAGPVE